MHWSGRAESWGGLGGALPVKRVTDAVEWAEKRGDWVERFPCTSESGSLLGTKITKTGVVLSSRHVQRVQHFE